MRSERGEENSMGMEVDEVHNMEVNGRGIASEDPPYTACNEDLDVEVICIRVFRSAKDWQPLDEIELRLESCGGLNLELLQGKLGGPIQVSYNVLRQ